MVFPLHERQFLCQSYLQTTDTPLGVLLGAFSRKMPRLSAGGFGLAEPAGAYQSSYQGVD